MVDEEKPTAAFAGAIGFLVFHVTINYILGLKGITADSTAVKYLIENNKMDPVQASFVNAQYETVLGIFTYCVLSAVSTLHLDISIDQRTTAICCS